MESGVSAARLTPAEARALGLPAPKARARTRTTRKVVRGQQYHTVCKVCDEEFLTQAAEDRHLADTGHARYELRFGRCS